jgi:hypothetical protein
MDMQTYPKVQKRLIQHYRSIGVGTREATRFAKLVSTWCTQSGPEWTVSRLKELSNKFKLSLLTEDHYSVGTGWRSTVNRKGQTIYYDRLVHRFMTLPRSELNLTRCLAFFRAHEAIQLRSESKGQFTKWRSGVIDPPSKPELIGETVKELAESMLKVKIPESSSFCETDFVPLVYQHRTESKRSPACLNNVIKSLERTCVDVLTLEPLRNSDWFHLVANHPESVSECLHGSRQETTYVDRILKMGQSRTTIGGRIGFIQEPSAKLRAVANPYLVYQAMGEPSKKRLGLFSQITQEMHTFTQHEAKAQVAMALASGQKVWGFDASAFTDRLPYDLQKEVLKLLQSKGWITQFDIDVFDAMVNMDWVLPENKISNGTVRWTVGQPMGFGPSFHLAAITHKFILDACAERVGQEPHRKYVVIGDDVAIFNDDIAEEYYKVMTALGVDINLEKSLSSNEVSEFCKKLILPSGELPGKRVRVNLETPDAVVDAVKFYGKGCIKFLDNKALRWVDKILLPTDVGGAGLSPHGMRYKDYLSILNVSELQQHYLLRELTRFCEVPERQALELKFSAVAEAYDYWNEPKAYGNDVIALTSVDVDSVNVTDWTGLPANVSLTADKLISNTAQDMVVSDGNTFRRIYDCSLRTHLMSSELSIAYSEAERLFNDIGCINEHEKPFTRPIISKEMVNDQNQEERERAERGRILSKLTTSSTRNYWQSES